MLISIIGKLNNTSGNIKGFTLIELMVVISLISIMLLFAAPRLHDFIIIDNTAKLSRALIVKIHSLKERSLLDQKFYTLNLDLDSETLWIGDKSMNKEELSAAGQNQYELPDDLNLIDVEYPDQETVTSGIVQIRFYKQGYSDRVIIHMENENENERFSFLIEPFLTEIKIFEGYSSFIK